MLPGSTGNAAFVPTHAGSTYQWTISNGTITSSATMPAITFTAGSVGILTLTCVETDSNGCSSNGGSANVMVTGMSFHELSPCRVLDTRGADGPALAPAGPRTFVAAGKCGVPVDAKAISINLTATAGTAAGDLRAFAAGTPDPQTPIVNYSAGQTRANNGLVYLGPGGDFILLTGQATGTVHAIVDVNGYFQ